MKLPERAKNRGDYFIVRSTKEYCEIIYLPRTEGISTTQVKKDMASLMKLLTKRGLK